MKNYFEIRDSDELARHFDILNYNTDDELENLSRTMEEIGKRIGMTPRELHHAKETASLSAQAKNAFLSHLGRELRDPVNTILAMTTSVEESAAKPAKTPAYLNHIRNAAKKQHSLLNVILEILNFDGGRTALVELPFFLDDLYYGMNSVIGARCAAKGISYNTDAQSGKGIQLVGDRIRLMQVIAALLGNTLKCSAPGGEISFSAEILRQSEKSLFMRFEVSGTQTGIMEKQLDYLFNPFVPADKEDRKNQDGILLSICQNIVQRMGGFIEVSANSERSSAFSFEIAFRKAYSPAAFTGQARSGLKMASCAMRI